MNVNLEGECLNFWGGFYNSNVTLKFSSWGGGKEAYYWRDIRADICAYGVKTHGTNERIITDKSKSEVFFVS